MMLFFLSRDPDFARSLKCQGLPRFGDVLPRLLPQIAIGMETDWLMSGKVLLMSFNGSTLEAEMSKHKFVIHYE